MDPYLSNPKPPPEDDVVYNSLPVTVPAPMIRGQPPMVDTFPPPIPRPRVRGWAIPREVGLTYRTNDPKVILYMYATNELLKGLVEQNFCTQLDKVLLLIDNQLEEIKRNAPNMLIRKAIDFKTNLNALNVAVRSGIVLDSPLLSQENQYIFIN